MSTVDEESQAAKDAKTQGLDYLGFGRYGKDNTTTHISQDGKLVPKQDFKSSGPNKSKIATQATKAARRGTSPVSKFNASVADFDPETNRVQSRTAGNNRDFQRSRTRLKTATGTTNFDDPLLKGKGFTSPGDMGHTTVRTSRNVPFSRSAQRAKEQITDKARQAFPDGSEVGTQLSVDDFQKKTGISNTEIAVSQAWNKKYGQDYSRTGFVVEPDPSGVTRGRVVYTGQ